MGDRKAEEGQAEIIAFLESGAWTRPRQGVQVISTHISHVFISPERVLKLKRAVRLPYVDFSTLKRRKAACMRELSLNRRTAPELYRGVVQVTRDAEGKLRLGGAGRAVDWLVDMRAFDQSQLLDRLAASGSLTARTARDLGDVIAAFHDKTKIARAFGGSDAVAGLIAGNGTAFAACPPGTFDPHEVAAVTDGCSRVLAAQRLLLDCRRKGGAVRECHGDLHLGNICLIDGRPVLFDCLEFDEQLSNIDVLYDLAFLLMDLFRRGLAGEANLVFNRYLDRRDEIGGLAALPLFIALRAAIRAHVTAQRAPSARREARLYLAAAREFLRPATPRLIAVGGLSGSGKTTMAYRLAPSIGAVPGARVVRSDVIRKRLFGVAPETRLSPDAYTPEVTTKVYEAMLAEAARVLAAGHSAILDAVFLRPGERDAVAETARAAGVTFDGIWLDAPPRVLEGRVAGRRDDASDADGMVLRKQLATDPGPLTWPRIDIAPEGDGAAAAIREKLA